MVDPLLLSVEVLYRRAETIIQESLLLLIHVSDHSVLRLGHDSSVSQSCRTGNEFHTFFPKLPILLLLLLPPFLLPLFSLCNEAEQETEGSWEM